MSMPMQSRGLCLLLCPCTTRCDMFVETIPQPNLTLGIARRKVFFRRMEYETRQLLRRDIFGEARLWGRGLRNVRLMSRDGDQPCSARRDREASGRFCFPNGNDFRGLLHHRSRRRATRYKRDTKNNPIVVCGNAIRNEDSLHSQAT
jgi:hypothetical protein